MHFIILFEQLQLKKEKNFDAKINLILLLNISNDISTRLSNNAAPSYHYVVVKQKKDKQSWTFIFNPSPRTCT